jgi:hypothetical protein
MGRKRGTIGQAAAWWAVLGLVACLVALAGTGRASGPDLPRNSKCIEGGLTRVPGKVPFRVAIGAKQFALRDFEVNRTLGAIR